MNEIRPLQEPNWLDPVVTLCRLADLYPIETLKEIVACINDNTFAERKEPAREKR